MEAGSAVPSDSSSHVPQDDAEERRAARFQLFKERQTAATAARVQSLEAVRARAAAFLARRERALAKVANAGEALGQALQRQMAAADERRSALLEAERCRLKQEHMLVLTTARLARNARLAHAAAKAGSKVARAKLPGNSGAAAWQLLSNFQPWEANEQVEQDVSARAAEAGLQGKQQRQKLLPKAHIQLQREGRQKV
ncbi:hypothetical protein HaLaN_01362 [Haematococcus lacustris]|uniref:Uncharacterized protein n=1 Tax=Haematococcus lacustris TaxID=44745 RepID=A0A699YUJ1_HAELA|nr:hypothetical protein HaLaN_01362 [Haematococcus lacustris]